MTTQKTKCCALIRSGGSGFNIFRDRKVGPTIHDDGLIEWLEDNEIAYEGPFPVYFSVDPDEAFAFKMRFNVDPRKTPR